MEGVTYTVFVIASVEVKKTNVHEANGKNPSVKVDFMDVDSQEKNSTALWIVLFLHDYVLDYFVLIIIDPSWLSRPTISWCLSISGCLSIWSTPFHLLLVIVTCFMARPLWISHVEIFIRTLGITNMLPVTNWITTSLLDCGKVLCLLCLVRDYPTACDSYLLYPFYSVICCMHIIRHGS